MDAEEAIALAAQIAAHAKASRGAAPSSPLPERARRLLHDVQRGARGVPALATVKSILAEAGVPTGNPRIAKNIVTAVVIAQHAEIFGGALPSPRQYPELAAFLARLKREHVDGAVTVRRILANAGVDVPEPPAACSAGGCGCR